MLASSGPAECVVALANADQQHYYGFDVHYQVTPLVQDVLNGCA